MKVGNKHQEPRINVYVCEYNCLTVTVDVDEGVTPFMIKCRRRSTKERPLNPALTGADGECKGTARSSFYPKGPKPRHIGDPTHEWYKPDSLHGLSAAEIQHVRQGGLLLRPRTDRLPVYHKPKEQT